MTEHRATDPAEAIPETDLVEQRTPVDDDVTDEHDLTLASSALAAEADLLEQSRPLPGDEDYPREPSHDTEP